MPTTLADLARMVAGRVLGDGSRRIDGANTLNAAQVDDITLLDSPDKAHRLIRCQAGAVVVPRGFEPADRPVLQVDEGHAAFAQIARHLRPSRARKPPIISPLAQISPSARIAAGVSVHSGATIGEDVVIGERTTIHSGVHILSGCRIGDAVTIFPGAILYE